MAEVYVTSAVKDFRFTSGRPAEDEAFAGLVAELWVAAAAVACG